MLSFYDTGFQSSEGRIGKPLSGRPRHSRAHPLPPRAVIILHANYFVSKGHMTGMQALKSTALETGNPKTRVLCAVLRRWSVAGNPQQP